MIGRTKAFWFHVVLGLAAVDGGAAGGTTLSFQGFEAPAHLGSFSILSAPIQTTASFCIASQSGSYTIQIRGTTPGGSDFRLSSGTGLIPYRVEFAPNGTNFETLTAGLVMPGLSALKTCAAGLRNAALRLTIGVNDFNLAPAGTYSDTLTAILSDL